MFETSNNKYIEWLEQKILKSGEIFDKNFSDVIKSVETDQLILIEPDKIYGHFELLKKENRNSYFLSKEEAKNLADFIYDHLHVTKTIKHEIR